ncbi:MAG: TlpA disulfide reductase family protein [Chitinophagales bacterium]
MTRLLTVLMAFLLASQLGQAQTTRSVFALDENSIIKDSTGRQITKIEFYEALVSGNFQFKPIKDRTGQIIEFLLVRCDRKNNNTQLNVVSNSGCAPTSAYTVGMLAPDFSGRDLSDTVTYDFNFFKGRKVVVLHFWFTKCKPCLDEIPDLNHLKERYRDRADIVFIAPTFELKEGIDEFLTEHRFDYAILPESYEAIKNYKVTAYPLNVIIDFEGRIAYISAGGLPGIEYLMDKKIRELLGMH